MFRFRLAQRRGPWNAATPADLQVRAMPLLYLSLASIDAGCSLVVSPGSSASKEFRSELDRLGAMLTERMPAPDEILSACNHLRQVSRDFAAWQRAAIEHLRRDLVEATQGVTSLAEQALDAQDVVCSDLKRLHDGVAELQQVDDLGEVHRKVRTCLAAAQEMLDRHRETRRELRELYEKALADLQRRVEKVEASGGVDFLTNAPNRAALEFYLQAVVRKTKLGFDRYSVALFDLDDFKKINDTYGHAAGDRALNLVVEHGKQAIGEKGYLARYGGDEFAIVYSGQSDQLVRRLLKLINFFNGRRFQIDLPDGGASIGIRLSAGVTDVSHGDTAESVIHRADQALYQAKRSGKGSVRKYNAAEETRLAA